MDDNKLFIPSRVNKHFLGISKREGIKIAAVSIIVAIITLIVSLIVSQNMETGLISMFIGAMISGIIAFFIFQKSTINLSIFDMLILIIKGMKKQKIYYYKKSKEWY